MTDEEKTAYEEGRLAATNLEARSTCPYEADGAMGTAWREGYDYVAETGMAGKPND